MTTASKVFAACLIIVANPAYAGQTPQSWAALIARVMPSVVSIASVDPVTGKPDDQEGGSSNNSADKPAHNTSDTPDQTSGSVLPPPKAEEALGSGFVFDPSGYILTNNHVINGALSVTVTFQDGTILPGTVVGRDKDGDLAVLKVDAGHLLPALKFGDSEKLHVGDYVVAIGNPFGLPGSTSSGIVSALHRNINAGKYDNFIQTDATINRGNSGGPLFNTNGDVIGVNSAIYSPSGGSIGIGFAIPSAMVAPVADALKRDGSMTRGWLGVSTEEVTSQLQLPLHLSQTDGALVGSVEPGSPAYGKLQPGDVIVAIGGEPIKDSRSLYIRVSEIPAGQSVAVQYIRGGSEQKANVNILSPPPILSDLIKPAAQTAPMSLVLSALGLAVADQNSDSGVPVIAVEHNGPAAQAGIVVGNVIDQIGEAPVTSGKALQMQIMRLSGAPAVLLVEGVNQSGVDLGPRWVAVARAQASLK